MIQSVSKGLASHEVRLRYCALEENDSDAQLFLARMNETDTQAAILLGIDDPHIHDLAVDIAKPCMLINCRDSRMRLPAVAPITAPSVNVPRSICSKWVTERS